MDEDTVADVNNGRVEPAWRSRSLLRSAAALGAVLSVVMIVNASSRARRVGGLGS